MMLTGNCFERAFWSAHTLDGMCSDGHPAASDVDQDSIRVVHAWCLATEDEHAGLPIAHAFVEYLPPDSMALADSLLESLGSEAWRGMLAFNGGSVDAVLRSTFGRVFDAGNTTPDVPSIVSFIRDSSDVWKQRNVWPQPLYFGIGNVGQCERYTVLSAAAHCIEYRHSGPWNKTLFPCSAYDADGNQLHARDGVVVTTKREAVS